MSFEKSEQFDLRRYLAIIRKRKILLILPFLGVLFTVMLGSLFMEPVYESSTTLLVADPRLLPRSVERMASGPSSLDHMDALKREISSRDYLRRLIKTLQWDVNPELRAKAEEEKAKYPDLSVDEIVERWFIDSLREKIFLRAQGSDLLTIVVQDKDPKRALLLAKTLAQVSVDETLRRELSGVRGALEFSNEQLAIYKQQMEDSEEELRLFREKMVWQTLSSGVKDQENLSRVSSEASTAEADLRQVEKTVTSLTIRLQNLSPGGLISFPDARISNMKAEYYGLARELAGQLITYTWRDAQVIVLADEIGLLREQMGAEFDKICRETTNNNNPLYCELLRDLELAKTDVIFYRNKWEAVNNYVDEYERSLVQGPQQQLTLERLQDKVSSNRKIYQMFLDQSQGAQIQEAAHRTAAEGKFRIMEPAMLPLKPMSPNRRRLALLGCVMGTLLGFSLIFLVEYLDHSLTTVEEVEQYLGLPVLGTIPRMNLRTSKRGRKVRIAVFLVLGMLVVVLIVIFIKQRMVGA